MHLCESRINDVYISISTFVWTPFGKQIPLEFELNLLSQLHTKRTCKQLTLHLCTSELHQKGKEVIQWVSLGIRQCAANWPKSSSTWMRSGKRNTSKAPKDQHSELAPAELRLLSPWWHHLRSVRNGHRSQILPGRLYWRSLHNLSNRVFSSVQDGADNI